MKVLTKKKRRKKNEKEKKTLSKKWFQCAMNMKNPPKTRVTVKFKEQFCLFCSSSYSHCGDIINRDMSPFNIGRFRQM